MASSVIGALRVNLGLDSAQFSQGLKGAEVSSNKFASAMKVGFAAAAAAAVAALGAIAIGVRNNLTAIDDMAKTASKIGIPIGELSKLKYAADLSGVSMQGLQTGVQRLSRNMADAAKGTGAGAEAFQQLGIQVKGADGRLKSSSQILVELADRFKSMPDGAQKTALAMELMGRSGADMIPLLNGGSEALNGLLSEAKAFGLEISAETGAAAEAFNDNISRLGYAFQGVTLSLTAALAPAMVVVSDALVALARGFVDMLAYLPQLAEGVAFVGGTMALAFSPAIVAAVWNLATAIGVGLVNAIRAVSLAMLANPMGVFIAGITLALAAVYLFRDEVKQAWGVDVVQTAKNVGNTVIGIMVGSFNAVMETWSQFPAAFGDLAVQAGNVFLEAIRSALQKAVTQINIFLKGLAQSVAGTPLEGLGKMLPTLDNSGGASGPFGRSNWLMDNPNAGAASSLKGGIGGAFGSAMKTDYIGSVFSSGTSEVQKFTGAVDEANAALGEMGGGGGGGKGGGSGGKSKLDQIKDNVSTAATEMERMVDTVASSLSSAFMGLVDGSKKVGDVLKDLLSQLASMLVNKAFQAILGAGGTGSGGGLLSGIGKLFGFARGGTIMPGGAGGIDSQLVAFRKSPNERVDISKPGQSLTRGEGQGGGVLQVSLSPDLEARILEQAGSQSIQITRESNLAMANFRQNGGNT